MIKVSVPVTLKGVMTLVAAAEKLGVTPESEHYKLEYEYQDRGPDQLVLRVESEHFHAA